jgi:hypothetical protein
MSVEAGILARPLTVISRVVVKLVDGASRCAPMIE